MSESFQYIETNMKFGRTYTIYVESEVRRLLGPDCPHVRFKQFKKLLKRCPHVLGDSSPVLHTACTSHGGVTISECVDETENATAEAKIADVTKSTCSACDADFFSHLDKEVSAVVSCFNARATELLGFHMASGLRKYLLMMRRKIAGGESRSMVQIGNSLVSYGCMNAIAIRKILKKYDKIHRSDNGQTFKSLLQVKRVELLQSPLLIELGALAVNLMDANPNSMLTREPMERVVYSTCSFDNDKKVISCVIPDGMTLDFDLMCSICLETVFDPIALGCGHIFCTVCACAAAHVSTFNGATSAKRNARCPVCRQTGVYADAVSMGELFRLISYRCQEYYQGRLPAEREQRVRDAKEHWEKQSQLFLRL